MENVKDEAVSFFPEVQHPNATVCPLQSMEEKAAASLPPLTRSSLTGNRASIHLRSKGSSSLGLCPHLEESPMDTFTPVTLLPGEPVRK